MTQECAAEGCTHERTVLWQPVLDIKRVFPVAFYRPTLHGWMYAAIPLCEDHAAAVKATTPFQFIHKSNRYTFDGEDVVPYATAGDS